MLSPPHDHARAHVSLSQEVGLGYSPGSRTEVRPEKNSLRCLETLPYVNPSTSIPARQEHGACSPFWLVKQRSESLKMSKCPFDGQTLETNKSYLFSIGCKHERATRAARRQESLTG